MGSILGLTITFTDKTTITLTYQQYKELEQLFTPYRKEEWSPYLDVNEP